MGQNRQELNIEKWTPKYGNRISRYKPRSERIFAIRARVSSLLSLRQFFLAMLQGL